MITQAKLPHAETMTVYDYDDPPVRYERVFTGTRVYFQDGGKWVWGPTTLQAEVKRVEDNFRMTVGLTCNLVGSERIANQAASIFMVHMELGDLITTERIWISDSSQLPLKMELPSPHSKVVWTFRYENIEPPEGTE
jgi:hypothetical protein